MQPDELPEWVPFLKRSLVFRDLVPEDLEKLALRLRKLSLPKGATLYSRGEPGDAFYVIASGQVRLLNERAIARVNAQRSTPTLRQAHTNLFPHIDFQGVRITELARRLDISKQAVSQSVAELEALGVVELLVDPEDARAKLVRFTAKGAEGIAQGLRVLGELELELEARIGERHMRALHRALLAAANALEPAPSDPQKT